MAPHDDPNDPAKRPDTYNHLIHTLLALQSAPPPPQNYPWPPPAQPVAGPSSYYPIPPQPAASSQHPAPVTAFAVQDPEGTEDGISATEDKRRRNTAASARFRVKKKLKTLNLERSVADLTGRTEELEREAADLRRENTWLKEIVLLKGRNLSAPGSTSRQDDDDDEQSGTYRREKGKEKESGGHA